MIVSTLESTPSDDVKVVCIILMSNLGSYHVFCQLCNIRIDEIQLYKPNCTVCVRFY